MEFSKREHRCNLDNQLHYIKYAKGIRKLAPIFESRFNNLDKYNKIFEIYSPPFHVDAKSTLEWIQYNNELKRIFKMSESKINFYNNYFMKEKFSNLRNLAQNAISIYESTCTCESFNFENDINQTKTTLKLNR